MCERTIRVRLEQPIPSPPTERRHSVRYACRERPVLRFLVRASGQRGMAILWDVSVSGVSLVLPHRLEPGTVLALELPGRYTDRATLVSGQVIHATLQPDSSWRMGCALASRLSEPQLHDLLEAGTGRGSV